PSEALGFGWNGVSRRSRSQAEDQKPADSRGKRSEQDPDLGLIEELWRQLATRCIASPPVSARRGGGAPVCARRVSTAPKGGAAGPGGLPGAQQRRGLLVSAKRTASAATLPG